MRPDSPRPLYAGPDGGPESPFPVKVSGKVIKGFGRGSKELGIPTANIPVEGLSIGGHEDLSSGVYFGWAGLNVSPKDLAQRTNEDNGRKNEQIEIENTSTSTSTSTIKTTTKTMTNHEKNQTAQDRIFPMVMSIGWNPFYKNTIRSVEVHIITPTPFPSDFYGAHLALVILGFIRPEYDYVSVEALVADIRTDIDVATRSLTTRPAYQRWKGDAWLLEQIRGGNDDDDYDDDGGGGGGRCDGDKTEEKETRDVVR